MNAALAWSDKRMSETRGEYHTSSGAADTETPPENVLTLPEVRTRGFTQADNAYYGLIGVMSPTTYYVLSYLVRRTLGYHQDSARLSLPHLEEATHLSRHTILKALADLDAARIVTSDASARGRTQVRTYTLLPIEGWNLNALQTQTSAKNALVETCPSVDPQLVQKMHQTRAKSALVVPKTSAKNAPLLNKENLNKHAKENSLCPTPDGADGGAAPAPPVSLNANAPKAASVTVPEDGDAVQLAACLRDAILAHSPNARDAKAALQPAKLHQWARPIDLMLRRDARTPAGIRAVIAFATTDSFWQSNILSPGKLRDQYDTLEARMRSRKTAPPTTRAAPNEPKPLPVRRDLARNAKPAPLE